MRHKTVPHDTENEIIIPELEEAARNYIPKYRSWTEKEIAIVKKYYGKVPIGQLAKHLKRSIYSIQQTAAAHGISAKQQEQP